MSGRTDDPLAALDDVEARALLEDDLVPFGSFAAGLVDLDPIVSDDARALFVERLVIDQPIELEVRTGADGGVEVLASPPTQQIDTSLWPVLHRLKLTYVGEPAAPGSGGDAEG